MFIDNDLYFRGYYTVGDNKFTSKTAAVYESWRSNQPIKWHYHTEVFDSFYQQNPPHTLGKQSLESLYRERAQQLRDKYDYLILHYSGGSDSHNILMTFLNNNIKLDEVFNRRHDAIESKIYTPDPHNFSNSNFQSEWDYSALPTIRWLARTHPEIKITTSTMFDTPVEQVLNDDTFAVATHFPGMINLWRSQAVSPTERELRFSGKSIANILGNDKPVIYKKENVCLMAFVDAGIPNPAIDSSNKESFYWSPDFPQLAFNQGYRVFQYYLEHPEHLWVIEKEAQLSETAAARIRKDTITKHVIYPTTWDSSRFQTVQADSYSTHNSDFIIADKDRIFVDNPHFAKFYDRWLWYYRGYDIKNLREITPKICTAGVYWMGNFPEVLTG